MTTYDLLRALRELAIEAARAGGPLTPRWLEVARALSGIPDTSVRRPDDDVREPDVELRVPVRTEDAGGEHFVRLAVPAAGVYFVAAWTGHVATVAGRDEASIEDAAARGVVRAEEWVADGARLRELLADDGNDEPSAISVTREETAPPPPEPAVTIAKRRR